MSTRPLFAATPIEILTSRRLSHSAKTLYGIIAYTSGYPFRTRPSWYTERSLAGLMGCNIRTVVRLKKELHDAGVITKRVELVGNKTRCYMAPRQFNDVTLEGLDPSVNNGSRAILQKGLQDVEIWGRTGKNVGGGTGKNVGSHKEVYMKHEIGNKSDGLPSEKGSVEDSMAKGREMAETGRKKKEARDKKAAAKIVLRASAGGRRTADPGMMIPKEFCKRLSALLEANYVETADPPQTIRDVPKQREAAMKKTLAAFKTLGVDRVEFLKILEWLIPGWEAGLKRGISDRPFSIFTLYYRSKQILSAYRSHRQEAEDKVEETKEEIRKRLGDLGEFY